MQLGFELGRLGKPALAEPEFRQVLRLDPNSIDARVDLGIALYEQKKLDDALKQFEDVLQHATPRMQPPCTMPGYCGIGSLCSNMPKNPESVIMQLRNGNGMNFKEQVQF
jgi:tetratricopeptide (TPR) repeat protein